MRSKKHLPKTQPRKTITGPLDISPLLHIIVVQRYRQYCLYRRFRADHPSGPEALRGSRNVFDTTNRKNCDTLKKRSKGCFIFPQKTVLYIEGTFRRERRPRRSHRRRRQFATHCGHDARASHPPERRGRRSLRVGFRYCLYGLKTSEFLRSQTIAFSSK